MQALWHYLSLILINILYHKTGLKDMKISESYGIGVEYLLADGTLDISE